MFLQPQCRGHRVRVHRGHHGHHGHRGRLHGHHGHRGRLHDHHHRGGIQGCGLLCLRGLRHHRHAQRFPTIQLPRKDLHSLLHKYWKLELIRNQGQFRHLEESGLSNVLAYRCLNLQL